MQVCPSTGKELMKPSHSLLIMYSFLFILKKVNAKNAFDVDLSCISRLPELLDAKKDENNWVKTGEALGAGAKIYGYRVDYVHMQTYKFLSELHRKNDNGENEFELVEEDNKDNLEEEDKPSGEKKKQKK